jgi:hypothetical protein
MVIIEFVAPWMYQILVAVIQLRIIVDRYSDGIHLFFRSVICYVSYLIDLYVYLLQIKSYRCKDKGTMDIPCVSLDTIAPSKRRFQLKSVDLNEIYNLSHKISL